MALRSMPQTGRRRSRPTAKAIAFALLVVVSVAAVGHQLWASDSPSPDRTPKPSLEQGSPSTPSSTSASTTTVDPRPTPTTSVPAPTDGVVGVDDGVLPDGVTVFRGDMPGVANLDPPLLAALRRAATDAKDDGVAFTIHSAWRSRAYQEQLLTTAIAQYGSEETASRWVAPPDKSAHVSGDAIDLEDAPSAWLAQHGAGYGLCRIYDNEAWHFELRPDAVRHGCPARYADAAHDPRFQ
jgi:LAS superfamily LD-carboxypeptidase LdcB